MPTYEQIKSYFKNHEIVVRPRSTKTKKTMNQQQKPKNQPKNSLKIRLFNFGKK